MESSMRKKDEEMNSLLQSERSREAAVNQEKKDWGDLRLDLENKLAEAQDLKQKYAAGAWTACGVAQEAQKAIRPDAEIQRENDELREALRRQELVTREVRREASESLQEMKVLSQQSAATYDTQLELERTIEQLEVEVREWRNRYAAVQDAAQGGMRASIHGMPLDYDAAKYIRDKGLVQQNGTVKDIHVTKFQMSIDELLQTARKDTPEKAVESMKRVVGQRPSDYGRLGRVHSARRRCHATTSEAEGEGLIHCERPHHGVQELRRRGRDISRVTARRRRVQPCRRHH